MARATRVALAALVVLSAGCIGGPRNVAFEEVTGETSFDDPEDFRGEFFPGNDTAVALGNFFKGNPCDGMKLGGVSRGESTIRITVGATDPLFSGGCGDVGVYGTYRVTVTNVSESVEAIVITEKPKDGRAETHDLSTAG